MYQRREKKPVAILTVEQQSSSRLSADRCRRYGVVPTGLNCFQIQRGWCSTLLGTSTITRLFMHDHLAVTGYKLLGMPCDCYWSPCLLLKESVFCIAIIQCSQQSARLCPCHIDVQIQPSPWQSAVCCAGDRGHKQKKSAVLHLNTSFPDVHTKRVPTVHLDRWFLSEMLHLCRDL